MEACITLAVTFYYNFNSRQHISHTSSAGNLCNVNICKRPIRGPSSVASSVMWVGEYTDQHYEGVVYVVSTFQKMRDVTVEWPLY